VIREQPRAPSEVVSGIPKELDRVIQRCLRKEPDRRFQNMLDVKVELQEIREETDSQPAAALAAPRTGRSRGLAAGLTAVLLCGAGAWIVLSHRESELPPARLATLAFLPGARTLSLSPDASQVAFGWQGEKGDSPGIYVNMIGSARTRRLTTGSLDAFAPSWSPDGRQIAFVRSGPEGSGAGATVHVASVVDGSERRVSDLRALPLSPASWSPDGRFVAVACSAPSVSEEPRSHRIYLLPVEGGEPRPLTSPAANTDHQYPVFSWDGRRLVYSSCVEAELCRIEVVDLGPDYLPTGTPRALTSRRPNVAGLAWARDQRSVVYGDVNTGRLWRAWVAADRPPEKVEVAGFGLFPTTSAAMDRLAYQSQRSRFDLYSYSPERKSETLLLSDATNPSLSPDDTRVVFGSTRGGDAYDIWLAAADGSNPIQLTRGPGIWQGSPRWSPDGRRIAFDSRAEDGRWAIWAIDVDGGSLRRLTSGSGNQNLPSWSRDGRHVYFQSDRGGGSVDVWRVSAAGGDEEQVTREGGTLPYEAHDGRTLFFKKALGRAPIMAQPAGGGPEAKVIDCVNAFGFTVAAGGLYHFACDFSPSGVALSWLDPTAGRKRFLVTVPAHGGAGLFGGLTASSDGKTILYGKWVEGEVLPMMVENFR
jgi:Tol biopolymer transport system component